MHTFQMMTKMTHRYPLRQYLIVVITCCIIVVIQGRHFQHHRKAATRKFHTRQVKFVPLSLEHLLSLLCLYLSFVPCSSLLCLRNHFQHHIKAATREFHAKKMTYVPLSSEHLMSLMSLYLSLGPPFSLPHPSYRMISTFLISRELKRCIKEGTIIIL